MCCMGLLNIVRRKASTTNYATFHGSTFKLTIDTYVCLHYTIK